MSLPIFFSSSEDYFKDALKFFTKYQQLFKVANTHILIHNILEKINVENLENTNVFAKDFDLEATGQNDFLTEFFEDLNKLKTDYDEFLEIECLENAVNVPVSQKKKHEIVYLAKQIKEMCDKSGCEIVVDFGSGLGYLDQLLHETENLKILGIECNGSHYVGAKQRQRKYHEDSLNDVKYINHTITTNSDRNIQEYVAKKFSKSNFCITGLHACADLTIDGITLFLKMPDAKGLILMPCCYHKMAQKSTDEGRFINFPLSSCLKSIYGENKSYEYIGVPFLRLAAQPPNRNESLDDLVFNLLARATLQFYVNKHGYSIKRNKRKAVKTKTVNRDFLEYLQNAIVGFTVSDDSTLINFNIEELQNIWREIEGLKLKAAIFILLQMNLQPIIEHFVLYDRVQFLKENGINNCYVKKIFNEKVSSKCLALVSFK